MTIFSDDVGVGEENGGEKTPQTSVQEDHTEDNVVPDTPASVAPPEAAAYNLGISYTCPVDAHINIKMLSTKTCNGCGAQRFSQADSLHLSLDLLPGGSVSQSLHNYLKIRFGQLDNRCQCGAQTLTEELSFLTLPNVLILHLKRFTFTSSFSLEKVNSPISLSEELVLSPNPIYSEEESARYSLVSIVSHLGVSAYSDHYICDAIHRPNQQDQVTDRWLTYNDHHVSETTRASVCQQRKRTAYLLFYEKQRTFASVQEDHTEENVVPDAPASVAQPSPPPGKKARKASECHSTAFHYKAFVHSDDKWNEDSNFDEVSAESVQSIPTSHGGRQDTLFRNTGVCEKVESCISEPSLTREESLSRWELDCLGLPNLGQTCYMNSTLQSLLTLRGFNEELSYQQEMWNFHPSSLPISHFMDVGLSRFDNDSPVKKTILATFKETVADFNPEFADDRQKDAHEFLSCVLNMLKSVSCEMQGAAYNLGISYICPVDAHIGFKMLSTKTCNGCGAQSFSQEDSLDLSLDLLPGGSVSQSLHNYLNLGQLDNRCQCGAQTLTEELSFLTLPNVLILHLKRFTFTLSFSLEKINSPISLSEELVLSPDPIYSEEESAHYSLVSVISHLGVSVYSGHYICDAIHRPNQQGQVTDRWLTYKDHHVSETTRASVCQLRKSTAYLLFYEKQMTFSDDVVLGEEKTPQASVQEDHTEENVVPDTSASIAPLSPPPEKKARKASECHSTAFCYKRTFASVQEDHTEENVVPDAPASVAQPSPPPEKKARKASECHSTAFHYKAFVHSDDKWNEDSNFDEVSAESVQSIPTSHGRRQDTLFRNTGVCEKVESCISEPSLTREESLSRWELDCLGLPNLGQTCYMNSTLQSLLTLRGFNEELSYQQEMWNFHPSSLLISHFMDVGLSRFDNSSPVKKTILATFKETVADFNPEFADDRQKDAHEFLSCVLNMLKSVSCEMQGAAYNLGISYICPVDAHIGFEMLSIKTCNGCGAQSFSQEDSLDLSLDLLPGGSVSQSLHNYLNFGQLANRCQCGAQTLTEELSFLTLPNVLILHLKRLKFTPSFSLEKVNSPIDLSEELVLSPNPIFSEEESARYSLVSVVSHLGISAYSGHYICEAVHRPSQQDQVTDCWLTYKDHHVSETTRASVCQQRKSTAYLLFYEKQP